MSSLIFLDIGNLCLLFFIPLISLVRGLSILLIFSKNQLLVSLVFFSVVFLFSFLLIFVVLFSFLCLLWV